MSKMSCPSSLASTWRANQLLRIKSCKRPPEAWKTLCNIHKMDNLSNILFGLSKLFTYKILEGDDLLDHINNVKVLVDRLVCLEVRMRKENIVMTLLKSCWSSRGGQCVKKLRIYVRATTILYGGITFNSLFFFTCYHYVITKFLLWVNRKGACNTYNSKLPIIPYPIAL